VRTLKFQIEIELFAQPPQIDDQVFDRLVAFVSVFFKS